MKFKALIVSFLLAGSATSPHILKTLPAGTILTTAAGAVVLFSPTKCEAAGPGRAFATAAVMLQPASCEAGVMDQLCSSLTSFLNEESAKADADAKACKKSCGWKKRKDDLLDTARKKAKESCSKGEAPDANELSKGLDRNTKDRLKALYDNNSRMFDGTAKLKAVDFNAASSKDATVTGKTAALGKGGNVTDLKSSEPATPKLNAASEFSLAKTSNILASTKTATATSAKTTKLNCLYGLEPMYCTCLNGKYIGTMCEEDCYIAVADLSKCPPGGIGIDWGGLIAKGKKFLKDAATVLMNPAELAKSLWRDVKISANHIKDSWTRFKEEAEPVEHDIKEKAGDVWDDVAKKETDTCGGNKFNPDRYCCLNRKTFSRTKIANLSDCKDHYRARDSETNGCSAGWIAQKLLEQKQARPYSADDPVGAGPTSFVNDCNTHDICYDDCSLRMPTMQGRKAGDDAEFKLSCDGYFHVDMLGTCKEANNKMKRDCEHPKGNTGVESCKNNVDKLIKQCEGFALLYYQGVQKYGNSAYNRAQQEHCTCCPKK